MQRRLSSGVGAGRYGAVISAETHASTQSMMQCVCSVLAHMLADPVYKVYVAALVSSASTLETKHIQPKAIGSL